MSDMYYRELLAYGARHGCDVVSARLGYPYVEASLVIGANGVRPGGRLIVALVPRMRFPDLEHENDRMAQYVERFEGAALYRCRRRRENGGLVDVDGAECSIVGNHDKDCRAWVARWPQENEP